MGELGAIRILLVDDHKLFREGVKRILEYEENFSVVAEGDDGEGSIQLVKDYHPNVVLMDINMPNKNGIEATKELLAFDPNIKVIMLSIHDDENYVTHAMKSGAQGYLLKEVDSNILIEAIKVVNDGGSYLHPRITHNLVREFRRLYENAENSPISIEHRKPFHLLTKRECEILQLLAEGKSNRGISETLYISEKTVKNHVSSILQKMDVNDRTQAVIVAIRKGWVDVL